MTIASDVNRSGPYNGNGVTTAFDYDFQISSSAHVKVVLSDVATGVETVLTLSTDYTVSGVSNPSGGQVTILTPPASGEQVTLLLNVPFTQGLDLQNQGAYNAEDVEAALDLATQRDQQLAEEVARSIKIPVSADASMLEQLVVNIIRVAASADNIDDVAGMLTEISAIFAHMAEVVAVANNIDSVENFGDVYYGPSATEPATRHDGGAFLEGDLYFNTTSKMMMVYQGSAWAAATNSSLNINTKSFVGTGAQTAFTLNVAPAVVSNILVEIGGVLQKPTTDYTVSDTTLTLASAPANGVEINTWVIATTASLLVPGDATVTPAKLANSAVETAKIADGAATTPKIADGAVSYAKLGSSVTSVIGKPLVVFRPANNEPPSTNYAVFGVRNGHPYLAFDTTTQWAAIFTGQLPPHYAGGGLTVSVHVMMASATTGTVGFDVAFERIDVSSLDLDGDSFATAKTITATTVPGTSGQILSLSVAFSNSEIDGLLAGELFRLRVRRDVANDNAAGDAQVIAVTVRET